MLQITCRSLHVLFSKTAYNTCVRVPHSQAVPPLQHLVAADVVVVAVVVVVALAVVLP